MPNLDLKLDVARIQAEQRAKEEKKRKEEENLRLQARKQHSKRPIPHNTKQIVMGDAIAKIVLQPLTNGLSASSANRKQRPLSKPENALLSQQKQPVRGSFSEMLSEPAPSPKRGVSGPNTTIKDHLTQLRLLLQKFFQNTAANKKLQQQKEAALQEALQQRAAAEEEEQRKRSRRF